MSLYDDMLAAHGTPAAALEAMRTALGYPPDRSLWRSEVEQWRQAAEGWQAQTNREVTLRERFRVENDALRAELERERHEAWVALGGTNVKALADALEDLHRYSLVPDHGYAGSPCEAKARAALEAIGREVP